jgi:hypothetical protein
MVRAYDTSPPPTDFPGLTFARSDQWSANRDAPVGKTYTGFRLQALAKALELKEFQIWQLPCSLNHVRLQK